MADEAGRLTSCSQIYQLTKPEVIEVLQSYGEEIDSTDNLDKLRRQLSQRFKREKDLPQKEEAPDIPLTGLIDFTSTLDIELTEQTDTMTPPTHPPGIAQLRDTVRKWNLRFNGETDPISFLERIDELAEAYEISKEQLLGTLPQVFSDKALLWYRNNKADWTTWEDFREQFGVQFLPRRYLKNLEEEIRTRVQKNREPARDYVIAIQTKMRRLGTMTPADQLERIYDNLLPGYKLYIKPKDCKRLSALLESCAEYEEIQAAMNQSPPVIAQKFLPKPAPSQSRPTVSSQSVSTMKAKEPPKPAATNPVTDRTAICWRCGLTGHSRFRCQNPAKKFCTYCRKEGVWTTDCCLKKSGN